MFSGILFRDNSSIIKHKMTVKKNPQELPTILRFRLKKAGTKILLFFIFATSISHPFEARGNSKFDSAFYHIAVNLAGSDVSKALHSADSLFLASIDDLERIRSKMLLASLQSQIGKRDNAIQNAIDAEVMASNHDWHDWQARICGFLSTQFRNAGMIKEGSHYLEKGLKASSLLTSPEEMHRLSGLAYQEKAYYAMLEKKNREAIEFLLNSENRFEQLPDDRNKFFFLAT